jgi:hypothetical protein
MRAMRRFIQLTLVAGLWASLSGSISSQGRLAEAKSLRCTFPRTAKVTWTSDGQAQAAVASSSLVLRFEAIDTDDGTAQLRTGAVRSDVTVRLAEGYLHLMQAFRTGPLYTTTIFAAGARAGTFKAVHSRHEYFSVPLPGATSSPEQYYGECEAGS